MHCSRSLRLGALGLLTAVSSVLPSTAFARETSSAGAGATLTPAGAASTASPASINPASINRASINPATTNPAKITFDGDTIACPLADDSHFIDSWGAARSGGRRHEGVDMIAPRGTPVTAAQDGDVHFKNNRLGGNAAWLTSNSGNKFYYAHLDAFEGSSRPVVAGEIIGYVGSTGNAKGPHLHFETHFDGSVENPYDPTFEACVQPTIDALQELDAALRAQPTMPAPGDADSALVAHRVIDLITG